VPLVLTLLGEGSNQEIEPPLDCFLGVRYGIASRVVLRIPVESQEMSQRVRLLKHKVGYSLSPEEVLCSQCRLAARRGSLIIHRAEGAQRGSAL